MHKDIFKSVPYFFFNNLGKQANLLHFVTTREGGVSEGKYGSLNLSLRVNDNPENVHRNRRLVAGSFNIDPYRLVFASQTHEDKVAIIDSGFFDIPDEEQKTYLQGVDALISNLRETCLCILTADCVPIVLYDPVAKAIGIAHAGWKGTVKEIVSKTVKAMSLNYGTKPEELITSIGPCISAESFEVGEEVAVAFDKVFEEREGIILKSNKWAKPHVDLVKANMESLIKCGVKPENIEVSGICTYQNPNIFFSARQSGEGRFASGIMIK